MFKKRKAFRSLLKDTKERFHLEGLHEEWRKITHISDK